MRKHDDGGEELHPAASEAVAFIDAWLEENAWIADMRSIDFALDLRHLLAGADESEEREPVGTSV